MSDNVLVSKVEKSQIIDKVFWKSLNKKIILDADSILKYLIISSWSDIDLDFSSCWDWANCEIYGIFLSKNKEEIKWNISVTLKNGSTRADVYLLSLMWDDAVVRVKWNIDIQKWIKWVNSYLLEENIVLWEKVKVTTLPILNVSSNDVSAWHGAKIQRLDSEKLFYMMSKWLSDSKSKEIIIKWYVNHILDKFDIWEDEKNIIEMLVLDYLL
jgi:Fe-S cluster assembly scaffold protein SufB